MSRFIDLTGRKFGDWTIIRLSHFDKFRQARWQCRCVCGAERPVTAATLLRGASTGCGCSADKRFSERTKTHGMTDKTEHRIWKMMKSRCSNQNYTDYKNYGGRGITVCDEWNNSFEQFYADMGPRPSMKHTLDRIDNSKGYSPDNCKWSTRSEQNRNHRRNRLLTYGAETMNVIDWARKLGITQQALQFRLKNWPADRALSEPANTRQKR
jgi:hypothetical protein